MEGIGGDDRPHDIDHLAMLAPFGQHRGVVHEQAEVAFAERLPRPLGPVLEPVLGQDVTPVQLGRRPVVLRGPGLPGPLAGGVEGLGVHPWRRALREQDDVVAQAEQAGPSAQRAPCAVQRLVQVVGGRRRIAVGPQDGHHGLAVQPLAAGKGQQLDQRLGLAEPPGGGRHRPISHGDLEPTQEPDPHACVVCHVARCPSPTVAVRLR
jgi:hypothetical protein